RAARVVLRRRGCARGRVRDELVAARAVHRRLRAEVEVRERRAAPDGRCEELIEALAVAAVDVGQQLLRAARVRAFVGAAHLEAVDEDAPIFEARERLELLAEHEAAAAAARFPERGVAVLA